MQIVCFQKLGCMCFSIQDHGEGLLVYCAGFGSPCGFRLASGTKILWEHMYVNGNEANSAHEKNGSDSTCVLLRHATKMLPPSGNKCPDLLERLDLYHTLGICFENLAKTPSMGLLIAQLFVANG